MKKESYYFSLTLFVAIILAFYGGMRYDQYQAQNSGGAQLGQQGGGRNFQGGARGARGGAGAVMGQVIKKDKDSITVELRNNGGTKLIFVPTAASVVKSVEASSSEIAVGKSVVISGKANSDGSITAQSVQLRDSLPAGGFGNGQPGAGQSGTSTQGGNGQRGGNGPAN